MCGLIGVIRTDGKDARKTALKRYEDQKSRGQEGFGFVALKDDMVVGWERTEEEDEIVDKLKAVECDALIFHHRIPTSTPNLRECNHPIKVTNASLAYDYYVIHNGVIWGEETERLHAKHLAQGFRYSTEIEFIGRVQGREIPIQTKWNDSESLAIELAQDFNKEGDGINIEGSVAFLALEVDKITKKAVALYWGSNGHSPLRFFEVKDVMITICSEGAGELVDDNVLYRLDFVSGAISARPYAISKVIQYDPADTTSYPAEDYYDLIEEQEDMRRKRLILEHAGEDTEEIDQTIEDIEQELREMEDGQDQYNITKAYLNG